MFLAAALLVLVICYKVFIAICIVFYYYIYLFFYFSYTIAILHTPPRYFAHFRRYIFVNKYILLSFF